MLNFFKEFCQGFQASVQMGRERRRNSVQNSPIQTIKQSIKNDETFGPTLFFSLILLTAIISMCLYGVYSAIVQLWYIWVIAVLICGIWGAVIEHRSLRPVRNRFGSRED